MSNQPEPVEEHSDNGTPIDATIASDGKGHLTITAAVHGVTAEVVIDATVSNDDEVQAFVNLLPVVVEKSLEAFVSQHGGAE